jgi:predicted nucleic acid-binding protein
MNKYSSIYVTKDRESDIVSVAKNIIATGVKQYDAYHIACAVIAKCDFLLSTDKRILKYNTNDIGLLNPVDFLDVYGGNEK